MAEKARTWGKLMWMLAVASSSVMAASPEGSPQQALVEIALASKPATVEKHLPESLLEALQRLAPADRALAEEKMLVGRLLCAQEGELVVPDDGSALLVALEKGTEQTKLEIRVEREINSGSDAILELGVRHSGNSTQPVLVWMRLEGTEWRVKQVDLPRFFERVALDDPGFAERFRNVQHKETDARITAVMYEILRALQQFAGAYPDVGFPGDLNVLRSGQEDEEANEEHAGLLRDDIAVNEFAQDGYTFRYELLREDRKEISPLLLGLASAGELAPEVTFWMRLELCAALKTIAIRLLKMNPCNEASAASAGCEEQSDRNRYTSGGTSDRTHRIANCEHLSRRRRRRQAPDPVESRQGPLSLHRVHQGTGHRLLRAHRACAAAPPGGTAGHHEALSRRCR